MSHIEVNLCGIIQLRIDPAFPWRHDWIAALGDLLENKVRQGGMAAEASVEIRYAPALAVHGAREVADGIFVDASGVTDMRYGLKLELGRSGRMVLHCRLPCLEWIIPALQCAALQAHSSLVHCAAVGKDGRAWLFPSWGGVGKTALVASLVNDRGWQFLGDDFILLEESARCHGFPKPMVVYPYHRGLFPRLFNDGEGPRAPLAMNGLFTRLALLVKPMLRPFPKLLQFARKHNPQSVRLLPSRVFGPEQIGDSAELELVAFLERVPGLTSPRLLRAGNGNAGKAFGTTLNEFDERCTAVFHAAMGAGQLLPEDYYMSWNQILDAAFEGRSQYIIELPGDLPVCDLPDAVIGLLEGDVVDMGRR